MDQLAVPKAAGPLHGLGEILNEGYELTDHVVVDEDHTFDGNNDVIEKLITGFKTFKDGVFKQKPELYDKLKEGQEPKMMMITCADSRVCPTMLHGLEAGEAFIVRNVANLVPPCEGSGQHHGTSAAIEYAVTVLNVENIIVMGHSSCGGIKALMSRDDFSGDFIGSWVKIGMAAKKKTLSLLKDKPFEEQCSFCEQEAVNLSLANLLTFPFIQERLHNGRLQIYGMHYDFVGDFRDWREDRFVRALPAVAQSVSENEVPSLTWNAGDYLHIKACWKGIISLDKVLEFMIRMQNYCRHMDTSRNIFIHRFTFELVNLHDLKKPSRPCVSGDAQSRDL